MNNNHKNKNNKVLINDQQLCLISIIIGSIFWIISTFIVIYFSDIRNESIIKY